MDVDDGEMVNVTAFIQSFIPSISSHTISYHMSLLFFASHPVSFNGR